METIRCTWCAATVRAGAAFCTACGRALSPQTEAPSVGESSPDVSYGEDESAAARYRKPLLIGAGVAVVALLGFVLIGNGKSGSGGSSQGRLPSKEPTELASADLDGRLTGAWRLGDLVVIETSVEGDGARVTAVRVKNGGEEWDEDANAGLVVGSRVLVAQKERLRLLGPDGNDVAEPLRLRDPVVNLIAAGDYVIAVPTEGQNLLIDVSAWRVSAKGVTLWSSDHRRFAEIDNAGGRSRLQQIEPSSGSRVGKRIQLSDKVRDVALLANGHLAVLEERNLLILDEGGRTVASATTAKSAYRISATMKNFIAIRDDKQTTVFVEVEKGLKRIGPDLDGEAILWSVGSEVFAASEVDGDTEIHRVTEAATKFVFDASGVPVNAAADGLCLLDGEDLDCYRLPGDQRPEWSLQRDQDTEEFEFVDGLVLRASYDADNDSTDLSLLG